MSQAGLVDVKFSHSDIATSFLSDAGTAIPLVNKLKILGTNGISTSGATNIVTVTGITSTAAATALLATKGVASFDDSHFVVTDGFVQLSGVIGSETIVTDAGSAAPVANIVNILGDSSQGSATSGAGNTVTVTNLSSTTNQKGVIELASDAEAISLIANNLAIVPSSLRAVLGSPPYIGSTFPSRGSFTRVDGDNVTLDANTISTTDLNGDLILNPNGTGAVQIAYATQYAIPVYEASGELTEIGPLADGELIIGATGATSAAASLASAGGTVTITPGANSINLEAGAAVPTTFTSDAGNAVPVASVLNVLGGNNISTTGAANNLTINLTGTTDHTLQVGNATGSLTSLAVGGTGVILTGAAAADPVWTTATYPATAAVGDILYGSALNTVTGLAFVATATRYLKNTGTGATLPEWGQVTLTNGVTGILPVTNGGTGVADPTDHVLLVGSGAAAMTEVAIGTNGQVLLGSTNADPIFGTISNGNNITWTLGAGTLEADLTGTTDHTVQVGNATGSLTSLAALGSGELIIGSVGADPATASLTAPAAGLTITGGAGTITFALDDDLAGVEGLATTGIVSRTGANTWAATTITQHAILIGDTGEVPANLGPLTDGQIIIGDTANSPVATTLSNGNNITFTNAAGSITANVTGTTQYAVQVGDATASLDSLALGDSGEVLTSNGAGSNPSWQATAVLFTWSAVTVNRSLVVNEGIIANKAGLLTMTLPATAAIGDVIRITGINTAVGWRIAQNANQQIHMGLFSTTAGAGGYIEATQIRDSVELVCVVAGASSEYNILSSQGNITIA